MTVFFIVGFIVSLLARIMFGAFADEVSFFPALLTPFTWITVGFGLFAALFIGIKIYKELRNK